MADLQLADLHGSLTDRALNSMNFLNEVANHYPDAISLAADSWPSDPRTNTVVA